MAKIKLIKATEIINSKAEPTIQTTVVLNDGTSATASCPTGTSTGSYEALDLRDHDIARFNGLGVLKAIENIETIISPRLLGTEITKQQEIDKIMIELDGTQNKSRLGSNAILSVSMAVCKTAAKSSVLPLYLYIRQFIKKENQSIKIPTPAFNMINGGKHAGKSVDFQEFLIIPSTSHTYTQSFEVGVSMYQSLKGVLQKQNLPTLVGDEGGFGLLSSTNIDSFSFLKQAAEDINLRPDFDVFFGLDAASNSFYKDGKYHIKDKQFALSSDDLIAYYQEINNKHHILYIEDPLAEDDWEGWQKIMTKLSPDTIIAGDDLIATNPYRLQIALDKKTVNAVIIKPNQIGTVIEALAVVEIAHQSGLKTIISHRSGETNDDFIADFAVAVSSDYVKFGAPARGERIAKYNRMLQIEQQLKTLSTPS